MKENYLQFKTSRLSRYNAFAYIDTNEFLADQIFINRKLPVKFLSHFGRKDSKYIIVFCKVKKKDKEKFLQALKELSNKMLLMGHTDYELFSSKLFTAFLNSRN